MFTKAGQSFLCVHKSGTLTAILRDLKFVICDYLLSAICSWAAGEVMQCLVSGLKVGISSFNIAGGFVFVEEWEEG